MADKLTIIRSLVGFRDDHNTHWCSTGWESHPAMDSSPLVPGFPPGDWPSLGSVLSRAAGAARAGVPPCVDLTPVDADARFILRTPPGQPGYLGVAHAGFEVQAVDRRNIMLNGVDLAPARRPPGHAGQLRRLPPRGRRARASPAGIDTFSGRPSRCSPRPGWPTALDLSREDGPHAAAATAWTAPIPTSARARRYLDQFLLARRRDRGGARCVTLAFSRWPFGRVLRGDHNWDWHRDLFPEARKTLPLLDLGLSALIEDLHDRGLLDDVAGGRLGRVRPHAADQRERRPRPLAAGVQRPGGRRRHAHAAR